MADVDEQQLAREIRERTIDAEIRARVHQGMDDEQFAALEAEVKAKFADEPLPAPMVGLRLAVRQAGGRLSTDDWRDAEEFDLAMAIRRADRG